MDDLSRRGFIGKIMAGIGTAFAVGTACKTRPPAAAPTLKGKKVLLVWGGWAGHDPKPCTDIFAPWIESQGADITVSDTLDAYLDKHLLASADLIVQIWTMGQITGDQEKALLAAVKAGAGIAGWHGGLGDSFRQNTEYQFMVGGEWVAHPGGVIDYSVQITDKNDPVTMGIND